VSDPFVVIMNNKNRLKSGTLLFRKLESQSYLWEQENHRVQKGETKQK